MNQDLDVYSMKAWCTALNVSRSGFYAWRYSSQIVKLLPALVSQNYYAHKGKIVASFLSQEIIAQGFQTSRSNVARVMMKHELRQSMLVNSNILPCLIINFLLPLIY